VQADSLRSPNADSLSDALFQRFNFLFQ